jgi:hypothetical protein
MPNCLQATPTFGSAAACEVPANVMLKTRIMALEIASDDNFFFIGGPFLSFGNQCRTVGELVIVHGSCGLSPLPNLVGTTMEYRASCAGQLDQEEGLALSI